MAQRALALLALPGDYNDDGIVDAADYTLWRDLLGSAGTDLAADGNGDNAVTQVDYDVWKSNFGQHAGSGFGATVGLAGVPEPPVLMLLILAAAGWLVSPARPGRIERISNSLTRGTGRQPTIFEMTAARQH